MANGIASTTTNKRNDLLGAMPNKSLDASGGGVFRIMTGPAMLD
jgi:hypothetical protein